MILKKSLNLEATMMQIESTVLQVISSMANREVAPTITLDSRLRNDLGFDSLMLMEICIEIEGKLNILLDEKIAAAETVRDVVALIKKTATGGSDADSKA